MSANPLISLEKIEKSFDVGKGVVKVLKGIDLEIENGEFVIIFGPSGCGKSTLLNTMVGLEEPTRGRVVFGGKDLYELKADERNRTRRQKYGIVHQQANWIKSLNVRENVAFPLCIVGCSEKRASRVAHSALTLFRLEEFENNAPAELSGGQQQRVSVTRALVTNPLIIVADEPTGNLDSVASADLMYVLQYLNSEMKRTVIMVTHNPDYEKYATKVVRMEDGKITETKIRTKVKVSLAESKKVIIPEETEITCA